MEDRLLARLSHLVKTPGNDRCADCSKSAPDWASYNLGIFVCENCAQIHRSLGSHISKVKSLRFDCWTEEHVLMMEAHGNERSREKYELRVPLCYRRPQSTDPRVLIEQWIQAKYVRQEFIDPDLQRYLIGHKDGYLSKQGKNAKKFARRRFVLNEAENLLVYFNKPNAKMPKGRLRLDRINVAIVPDKIGHVNGMQIIHSLDNDETRNIYVFADTGQEMVEWYTAIRSAKLNWLCRAYPNSKIEELTDHLCHDFRREGWLSKTGPRPGASYKKRWMSLTTRRLFYYCQPLAAFPQGEIFIGNKDIGYTVREGVPPGVREVGFTFTLKTPARQFHFSATTEEDRRDWLASLRAVIATPLSPIDSIQVPVVRKTSRSFLRWVTSTGL